MVRREQRSWRCSWCGRGIPAPGGPGRPRRYCRQACRQRDYEARRWARDLGLTEAELVITRSELDDLRDRLYELECAIEDVERDLSAASTRAELREALDWVMTAARPLLAAPLGAPPEP